MSTTRASSNTSTTKKNAFNCFLEYRHLRPFLFVSEERTIVAVPTRSKSEHTKKTGGFFGYFSYDQGLKDMGIKSRHKCEIPLKRWKYCDKIFEFKGGIKGEGEFELSNFKPGLTEKKYSAKIEGIKKLLRKGESYQVNFAQEFKGDFLGDPFAFFCAMYEKNPSDMSFYYEEKDFAICSNSPERLVSLRDGVLRSEPIKGTIGIDENPEKLLNSEKAYAELTMIVDLMRNDLGKISKIGSVKVKKHQELMKLANVWHTYSVIESELSAPVSEVLNAVFPGGSVTGCPKKRTMEIIDKLEDFSRGAYCGSAGYILDNGDADFNIMIRTGIVSGGELRFPAGGGILIDSNANEEYLETLKKAAVVSGLTK